MPQANRRLINFRGTNDFALVANRPRANVGASAGDGVDWASCSESKAKPRAWITPNPMNVKQTAMQIKLQSDKIAAEVFANTWKIDWGLETIYWGVPLAVLAVMFAPELIVAGGAVLAAGGAGATATGTATIVVESAVAGSTIGLGSETLGIVSEMGAAMDALTGAELASNIAALGSEGAAVNAAIVTTLASPAIYAALKALGIELPTYPTYHSVSTPCQSAVKAIAYSQEMAAAALDQLNANNADAGNSKYLEAQNRMTRHKLEDAKNNALKKYEKTMAGKFSLAKRAKALAKYQATIAKIDSLLLALGN